MTTPKTQSNTHFNIKGKHRGMFLTDLDGTLLRSDRTFAPEDIDALKRLGEHDIIRVIATGRSIYSFNMVADENLPVEFVIFSTGAGISQHPAGDIVRKRLLEAHEVKRAGNVLARAKLDFMIHLPIPDNHRFAYVVANSNNTDFDRRRALYSKFARPLHGTIDAFGPATQLLAVAPASNGMQALEMIRNQLPDFNVIHTTSPLDGESTWIEIFPATVSKSLTASWLAEKLNIDRSQIISVGNDYNDLDLLEWTENSYVVANAPQPLKAQFPTVASNNACGVAEAVDRWLDP